MLLHDPVGRRDAAAAGRNALAPERPQQCVRTSSPECEAGATILSHPTGRDEIWVRVQTHTCVGVAVSAAARLQNVCT